MSHRTTLPRLLIASLAAAALAAPAATAMPADAAGTPKDARQADMHASTVTAPKPAIQDLRTEAAADQSRPLVRSPHLVQDLRTEAVADQSRPLVRSAHLVGPPTWPAHPQPIAAQAPSVDGGGNGGGDDVPVLLIAVIGGTLAIGAGMAATSLRIRARTAH
jgi:hypothetical protein